MILIDFSSPTSLTGWQAIDDRVMGGVSGSCLRHDPAGYAVFEGVVSADNGGGFASVRHSQLPLGSPDTIAYRLQVLGDGKRYKLNLRTDHAFDGVNHQAGFHPPAGQWTTIELPLLAFVPTFRGRSVAHAPALLPARVSQVGLMIADQQWGAFSLGVQSIRCVTAP